jgi:hypothetical protein
VFDNSCSYSVFKSCFRERFRTVPQLLICFWDIQRTDDGNTRQIDLKSQADFRYFVEIKLPGFVRARRLESCTTVQQMTRSGLRKFFAPARQKLTPNVPASFISPDLDVNIELVIAQDELPSRISAISANPDFIQTGFQQIEYSVCPLMHQDDLQQEWRQIPIK